MLYKRRILRWIWRSFERERWSGSSAKRCRIWRCCTCFSFFELWCRLYIHFFILYLKAIIWISRTDFLFFQSCFVPHQRLCTFSLSPPPTHTEGLEIHVYRTHGFRQHSERCFFKSSAASEQTEDPWVCSLMCCVWMSNVSSSVFCSQTNCLNTINWAQHNAFWDTLCIKNIWDHFASKCDLARCN